MSSFRAIFKPSKSCANRAANVFKNLKFNENREIHDKNPPPDVYSSTKLISSHAQNFRLDEALKVFDEMPAKDTVVWNVMIKGCLSCGNLDMGLKLFDKMPERNTVSFTTIVDGFLRRGMIEEAKDFFSRMPEKDTAAWNAMLNGLFTNGRPNEAVRLFHSMPCKNVISWTTMISGLDQHGMSHEALLIFLKMVWAGLKPTSSTYSCVFTSCSGLSDLSLGRQFHGHALKLGCVLDEYVTASLVTFYAKCKRVDACVKAFDEKLHDNVVVWTALLTGYGVNSMHENGLMVFREMMRLKIVPNQSTFSSALNSSREIEVLDFGKGIHSVAIKLGLEKDPFVGNSLIVLYTKCGKLKDGILSFDETEPKNIVSWNSIIAGCAQHGRGMWALAFFTRMTKTGLEPDDITFTGLLTSCSHSGMLEKGKRLFESIPRFFPSSEKKLEHYACMVDILCRNGKLDEAEDLVAKMPVEPNLSIWLALLSGCRSNNSNVETAERVAKNVFKIEPYCNSAYVLLSNIYASTHRWADVARIRRHMKKVGTSRQPGKSWVVIRGVKHSFVSCDKSHPLSEKIYEKLDWLGEKLKEHGYVSEQRFALHDVEDEQKEELLMYHSERLAISFVLVSGTNGGVITVMKNVRTCGDCHSAVKLMAKIVGREIVVRDSSRFHHFRDGFCSCGDYW